ncbi:MAG: PQQ-binding-like beta-propeller repeat protein [Verrucomicrobia bacterium]|nr:PQQ-binding-like beta-propeller repeat protein [Verrucomicrobiota bacterium]
MDILRIKQTSFLISITCILLGCGEQREKQNTDWPVYLGDNSSSQYSSLDQINKGNIQDLEVAWTFSMRERPASNGNQLECNPLIIDSTLYGTNALLMVFALNAATGEERWRFDPFEERARNGQVNRSGVNRGLTYWTDGREERILYVSENYLYAINAESGKLIESFGDAGRIDLKKGLGRDIETLSYTSTSPGIIFKDLYIMGSRVSPSYPSAPGHIRAFNVKTGEQAWRFNTIPHPGEFGYDTWPPEAYKTSGGSNLWTGLSLDEERGLVYCPTGSPTFDYYGGDRIGANLFANTLLCLDAKTGKRVWHYQIVHHDLLDYDLPSPPNLFTVKRNGEEIPAVSQLTKHGYIFVFNRVTGEPLFPIEEAPVPRSQMPGEVDWPTQPKPTKPAPFVREQMTVDEITDISPESHSEILIKYSTVLPHVPWMPPSEKTDTIVLPGMWGGAEWGGGAMDPKGVLYFNSNETPAMLTMITLSERASVGENLYKQNCIACHGIDLTGGNAFGQLVPTMIGISERMSSNDIKDKIIQGSAAMPPFRHLPGKDLYQLIRYIESPDVSTDDESDNQQSTSSPIPYTHTGNSMWLDSKGYPAIKPPWGTMNAVDLNTGEYLWQKTFGEYPELLERGLPPTGRHSWGGPIVTAGGIVLIAANLDGYFRGYDQETGEEIWKRKLPVPGFATPSTYMVNGKQYVVIACGGGRGQPMADVFVAFALP